MTGSIASGSLAAVRLPVMGMHFLDYSVTFAMSKEPPASVARSVATGSVGSPEDVAEGGLGLWLYFVK